MRTFHRCMVLAAMTGAMVWTPFLMAQEKDRERHAEGEGSVQEAIRFEKAKQAAAERQERIEEAQARSAGKKAQPAKRKDKAAR